MRLSRTVTLALTSAIAASLAFGPIAFARENEGSRETGRESGRERSRAKSSAKKERTDKEKDKDRDENESLKAKDDDASSAARRSLEPRATSEIGDLIDKLEYPELQVVPRASERLRMEAQDERINWAYIHWQFELSGLATALAGTYGRGQARNDLTPIERGDFKDVMLAGQVVGLGWMVTGVLLGLQRPYRAGMNAIARYEGKDTRSSILRERLAEEALERPTQIIRPLQWVSAISNFGVNVTMAYYLDDKARLTAGLAALFAFVPLIIEDHAVQVYEKHLEYKSKIYGPVASVSPVWDAERRAFTPVASLTWRY